MIKRTELVNDTMMPSYDWSSKRLGEFCQCIWRKHIEGAWKLGKALLIARQKLEAGEFKESGFEKGNWEKWCKKYVVGPSTGTIWRYMRIASHLSFDIVGGLSFTEAYEMAGCPIRRKKKQPKAIAEDGTTSKDDSSDVPVQGNASPKNSISPLSSAQPTVKNTCPSLANNDKHTHDRPEDNLSEIKVDELDELRDALRYGIIDGSVRFCEANEMLLSSSKKNRLTVLREHKNSDILAALDTIINQATKLRRYVHDEVPVKNVSGSKTAASTVLPLIPLPLPKHNAISEHREYQKAKPTKFNSWVPMS